MRFSPRMVWGGMKAYPNEGLSLLLHFLTEWNLFLMRAHARAGTPIPQLYQSGIRYIKEDYDSIYPEDWLDCVEALTQLENPEQPVDCEDLAAYRAAELRFQGERARCVYHRKPMKDGGQLVHIFVERGNGRLEDPSRLLGMEG